MQHSNLIMGIVLGLILLGALIIKLRRQEVGRFDYKTFFILGLSLAPFGLVMSMVFSPAFLGIFGIGIIYLIIGMAKADEWSES